MKTDSAMTNVRRAATASCVALALIGLAGCSGEVSAVDKAQARVTVKERAVTKADAEATSASDAFCQASQTYIVALDRYGDVLHDTTPTVGDVKVAGADLADPREDAFDDAETAITARQALADAQAELADAQAALAEAQAAAGVTGTPVDPAAEQPSATPQVPSATVDRVKQAETEYASAQGAITDQTTLADASELFNSAVVALEFSWLRLFVDAGCVSDDQAINAQAAVTAYTAALQEGLSAVGYYGGPIDGVYGPETVTAVEDLQAANGLPTTGTVDKATADALQKELEALGGAAAQQSVATTAALQQTLKLVGFWDGPVDGEWSPELTEALQEFQVELGVEPTGNVDAATIIAFEQAIAELTAPTPTETPEPEPEPTEEPSPEPTESEAP